MLLLPGQSQLFDHAGAISEPQVVAQFLTLLAGGLGVSYTLDRWAGHEFPTLLCLATFGSFISYIYSAPPLKLKQSGWIGNYALGSSYIALPWWAGQVLSSIHTSIQYAVWETNMCMLTYRLDAWSCAFCCVKNKDMHLDIWA